MSTLPQQDSQPSVSIGRSAEEIEREIEDTREQRNRTLGELESKLSPRERLREAVASARQFALRLGRSAGTSLGVTTMIRLDHTHALALFRRFKPRTSAARRKALATNVCLALEVHAQLEEEIFYPVLRELEGDNSVLSKSVAEHDEMRQLMRAVLHHVADEESTLLPLAERLIPDRLSEMGRQMTRRRIELLRPHLGEIARTSAQSFPVATAAAAAGLLAIAWFITRPRSATRIRDDWLA